MGLGVLDAGVDHVPGTTWVYEDTRRQEQVHSHELKTGARGLKFDHSGKEPVILVPQPSDDPNDPLNWPLWKRDMILIILCLISVIAATLSPLLAADSITMLLIYRNGFQSVANLTAWHLCAVGVSGFLFVASARIWGKRHVYLLGNILLVASTVWGGYAGSSYESMVWARIIQGVGLAPFEGLVNASVSDIFFVHQRGTRMAISNMSLFGGAFLTPIIVGVIVSDMSWEWTFWFVAIFSGILFPAVFFLVPETAFRRADKFNTDLVGDSTHTLASSTASSGELRSGVGLETGNDGQGKEIAPARSNGVNVANPEMESVPEKISYWKTLLPFNGRKSDENFFLILIRPLYLFLHPGILWACLVQGALIGWTVMIGVVVASLFILPPYSFDVRETGYLYAGPFIGAIIGFILCGLMADWSTRVMIKWNKGVFEPEFRIVIVIPQFIFGTIGLFGFGEYSRGIQGPVVPSAFFGFVVGAMVFGAVASALYISDGHRDISVEGFTCLLIFKNVFSFGVTFAAFDWIGQVGAHTLFQILGGVQVGICLLSIPMYIFGKRNRALMHRYDLVKIIESRLTGYTSK